MKDYIVFVMIGIIAVLGHSTLLDSSLIDMGYRVLFCAGVSTLVYGVGRVFFNLSLPSMVKQEDTIQ